MMKLESVLIVGLLLLCCVAGLAAAQEVTLVSSEHPPYFGENLGNYGFITEIIVEAYKKAGYDVKVEFMPWARGLELTKQGDYDGMFALWHRKDREEWFVFSDPLPPNELGFYKRASDDISFTTLEDLKPYVIGTVRGYANPPEFDQASYLRKEETVDDETNLRKLLNKRVDLVVIDKGLAMYTLETEFPNQKGDAEWIEPALEKVDQHLVISKKAKDYQQKLEDFNRGLKQLTEEGGVQEILTKHGF